jgi:hypothetical protein
LKLPFTTQIYRIATGTLVLEVGEEYILGFMIEKKM